MKISDRLVETAFFETDFLASFFLTIAEGLSKMICRAMQLKLCSTKVRLEFREFHKPTGTRFQLRVS